LGIHLLFTQYIIDKLLVSYNPDWALQFEKDNEENLFFVVQSKGTLGLDFLRQDEIGNIDCDKKKFKELTLQSDIKISLEFIGNIADFVYVA
jgi:type III restriction enzyme